MLSLAIQAGGQSTRMGQDKALLPFLGQPLISRVIARLQPLATEILVTTNNPEAYAFLGVPLYLDAIPGRGALGGLYTALLAAAQPLVAVVACDMPFVSAALLAALREGLLRGDFDAALPQTEHGYEPLHAIYRCATCLPAVKAALDSDKWRLDAWLPEVKVLTFSEDEIRRYDPEGRAFWNLNDPEEFRAAEEMARDEA